MMYYYDTISAVLHNIADACISGKAKVNYGENFKNIPDTDGI
jgi:hypothetical protein